MKDNQYCVDYNKDGKISTEDLEINKQITDLQIKFEKDKNQVKLAWVAMGSILITTIVLFTPIISDSRIEVLQNILDAFYITQASVIGFYVGANTYLNRNVKNTNTRMYYDNPDYHSN